MHGLTVDSPFRLAAAITSASDADLRVRPLPWQDRTVPATEPIVELVSGGKRRHAAWRDGEALVISVPGVATFRVEGRELLMRSQEPERGLAQVLLEGFVLALILQARHHLVLHASAVEIDGVVVAFIGQSNAGKSTLAAACCTAGALLVADDVLRVDVAEVPAVHRGADRLRLRLGAEWVLTGLDPSVERGSTADGRIWVRPAATSRAVAPLAAVAIPRLSTACVEPRTTRLGGAAALIALEGSPRILGWRDPAVQAAMFAATARLVQRVPVFSIEVPWSGQATADRFPSMLVRALRQLGS